MVAISSCPCSLLLIFGPKGLQKHHQILSLAAACRGFELHCSVRSDIANQVNFRAKVPLFHVLTATKGSAKSSEPEEKVPSWAQPDTDEPPPWARAEVKPDELKDGFEPPFFVFLLASAVTAIAAIGSIFEYANQKPVFGVLNSDSIFYAPVLGFFVFTGIPTSAFLWYKSVQAANKEAEEQDLRDGFR